MGLELRDGIRHYNNTHTDTFMQGLDCKCISVAIANWGGGPGTHAMQHITPPPLHHTNTSLLPKHFMEGKGRA